MPSTPPNKSPQTKSVSYRLPVEDTDFLHRDEVRGVRLQLEYEKPEILLREWGVRSTIIVFGSARIPSPEKARAIRKAAGGGPGVMEAANRGAHDVGAPTIGFNINLPAEQFPNPYTTPELTFRFQYFGMRKMHMALRTNALVVFPGGFGTLDELFELITLQQTGKTARSPIVLFDEAYWKKLINFDLLVEEGMIAASDLNLIAFAETAEEVWSLLVERGLRDHGPVDHHR